MRAQPKWRGRGINSPRPMSSPWGSSTRPCQAIAIAGRSPELKTRIEGVAKKVHYPLKVVGFTTEVPRFMAASDLLVSKPGGLTSSEALAMGLPIMIVNPIPGQEANNTAYLTAMGAAIKLDFPQDINLVIDDLISKPEKLSCLRKAAVRISKPNASMDTAKLLLNLYNA